MLIIRFELPFGFVTSLPCELLGFKGGVSYNFV